MTRIYKGGDHEQKALDGVNQSLEEGKFIVILGPSGAGKSTLLNILGIMSYLERSRELATLKVLGFRDKQIGRLLLISQNIWLTVVGVIIGLPAGVWVL